MSSVLILVWHCSSEILRCFPESCVRPGVPVTARDEGHAGGGSRDSSDSLVAVTPVLWQSHEGVWAKAVVCCLLPGWFWGRKALLVLVPSLQLLGQQSGVSRADSVRFYGWDSFVSLGRAVAFLCLQMPGGSSWGG